MNKNETETTRDTLEEVIYECPDDTSPYMMEDCVSEEHEDRNQNYLI